MKDTFTISIYGASGFTGRIAAESLSQVASLRLLIAGRNKEKLEAVANSCKHRPEIFVADAQDRKRLSELVAKSDVILNFAGPFLYYAETLISEVVRQGKRYCDISGETVFYADMQEKYEAEAKRTGATLIPMA